MRILKFFRFSRALTMVALLVLVCLSSDANAFDSKSNRENSVRVDVKPVQLASGQQAKFEVRMNTHSGNLGQDMAAVCTLKDDQGREYRPVNWQGSPPGGHHRRGVLEFPTLDGSPKSVTLVIRNIANVPERIFEWEMGK